ncbi:MAG: hypothetical protein RQ736_04595 [Thiogranum sp.]|nr:hypothetical protein [Thiogranum sp.]
MGRWKLKIILSKCKSNNRLQIDAAKRRIAEALLWKMGKWNIYKDFVNNYNSSDSLAKKTDVVFAAFAKHLRDSANPVYDQHALRAMWAINANLVSQEKEQCKAAAKP